MTFKLTLIYTISHKVATNIPLKTAADEVRAEYSHINHMRYLGRSDIDYILRSTLHI